MNKRSLLFLLVMLCGLLAFGCAEESKVPAAATSETTGTGDDPTHPASPGGTAVVPDATGGATVEVLLADGRIALPTQAVPPGPAVLTVTNGGKETHNLHVEGPGVAVAGDPLPAGNTRPIDVTFQAGTYTFYCPIQDHRTKGEEATLTITR